MTPVSEAVERDEHWRAHALRSDRLLDEKDAQIARLTEQVRVASMALEPFARAAVEAERQTGTNETSGTTALCRAARGETAWADYVRARETLTHMEKNDDQ